MSRSSCSFLSFPQTRTSSIRQRIPSRPARILLIRFWKCSVALEIPNGNFLKQYRPNGVMNVVRGCDCLASGICQNPLLASSLLKTLAPVSCASVSSTLGKGYTSRRTLSFKGLRSTQIRRVPFALGTTTIPAHQGVGSSTGDITPSDSIRASSSSTFGCCGSGMWRGAMSEYGLVSGLSFISYSSPRLLRP